MLEQVMEQNIVEASKKDAGAGNGAEYSRTDAGARAGAEPVKQRQWNRI